MNQHQKVVDFRKRFKDRGVYAVVNDKYDLQRQFTNHLALYFIPLISGEKNTSNEMLKPILKIRDVNTLSEEYCSLFKYNLLKSRFINDEKKEIIENIKTLNETILCKPEIVAPNILENNLEKILIIIKTHIFQI